MMKLFLCSYFAGVASLLSDFIKEDLSGKSVAFIPTAGNTETIKFYIGEGKKALESFGMTVHELDIPRFSNIEIASIIDKTDYIYVSGGNTFFLLQELKRHGVDSVIAEYVKAGKPYIGESAGAIITAPSTEYMKTVNFDPVEKAPELNNFSSLGLVEFYTVPHYGEFPFKKKAEKVIKLYADSLNLIPVNNRQAIFVEGDSAVVKNV